MKTYVFQVEMLYEREDGYWVAWLKSYPKCSAWGYFTSQAVDSLRDSAQEIAEMLIEKQLYDNHKSDLEFRKAPLIGMTVNPQYQRKGDKIQCQVLQLN